jgi:UrcA family protein
MMGIRSATRERDAAAAPAKTGHANRSQTMTRTSSIAPVLFALAATLGVMAVPARTMAAEANGQLPTVSVPVADLDLATPEGQRQLDRRIRKAARTVCGGEIAATGTRLRSRNAESCYQQALRQTRSMVAEKVARGHRAS